MDETLRTMGAYLRANPSTVLMLMLESYVTDADLQQAFAETGTEQYAATLSHGEPLPTLGELIAEGHRLVVFTEKTPRDRTIPWLNDAFTGSRTRRWALSGPRSCSATATAAPRAARS